MTPETSGPTTADRSRSEGVLTGLDRLLSTPSLQERFAGKRLGLLVNQASVSRDLKPAYRAIGDLGLQVVRLFAPEHGLWGQQQDMEEVAQGPDPLTGLESRSLYGKTLESLKPAPEDLADLDILLIDLPDIGTRYYTFAATALYATRAAHQAGVGVCVLDRPNPLGGILAEGNLVEPGFHSFVGAISVPNRHALTLAELLRYANLTTPQLFDLEWIPVAGWQRFQWFDQTGLPWVLPSPNMPTLDTALVYPGMCLLEATNLSEGRGTTRPFEIMGAPYVNGLELVRQLEALDLPGVRFRPLVFRPLAGKWAGQPCQGLQLHVVDRETFRPYRVGLAVLWACMRLFGQQFAWRKEPYEFVAKIPAIDLLCGTDRVRRSLEQGDPYERLVQVALAGAERYLERVGQAIIYE